MRCLDVDHDDSVVVFFLFFFFFPPLRFSSFSYPLEQHGDLQIYTSRSDLVHMISTLYWFYGAWIPLAFFLPFCPFGPFFHFFSFLICMILK